MVDEREDATRTLVDKLILYYVTMCNYIGLMACHCSGRLVNQLHKSVHA